MILALGFGVEKTLETLPRLSYWRLDSIDQPRLDSLADPCESTLATAYCEGVQS